MSRDQADLDALWDGVRPDTRAFDPGDFRHLPEPVQRYLGYSIAPGTSLASAVRLRMRGSIRLAGWRAFQADEVIARDRGMIWRAATRLFGMPIRGSDRLVDGVGAMRWRLLGFIPLTRASDVDVTRSAAGRLAAESIWLPSMFCDPHIEWANGQSSSVHAKRSLAGQETDVALTLNQGCIQSVALRRWGNPGDGTFRYENFGAIVEREATFGGYTIPVRIRAGWYFGDERFDDEGQFFQATVMAADYR
jgi:hypothetical protein